MRFLWREKVTVLMLCLVLGTIGWVWQTLRVYPARAGFADQVVAPAVLSQLKADVMHLSERIGPRNQSTSAAALRLAEDWLVERLGQMGLKPQREPVNSPFGLSHNVFVEIPGASEELMILGTHYDSHPHSPGADDNASGVAVLLGLLERLHLQQVRLPHTLRAYFFTNEEWPFFQTNAMGSRVAARNLALAKRRVAATWILDAVGYFTEAEMTQEYPWFLDPFFDNRGDFLLLVSDIKRLDEVTWLRRTLREKSGKLKIGGYLNRQEAEDMDQSDHASFWEFGYPALLITDTAFFRNPYYHLHSDATGTLDYERLGLFAMALEYAFQQKTEISLARNPGARSPSL